jgi:uncharacterized membrane protein YheB (UPF0754 family)
LVSEIHAALFTWSLPLLGAFNGWFTTHLAIRMLFRPRRPIRFAGLQYHAPLPKRQAEIAERIGEIVEGELLNYDDIRAQVLTPAFIERVEQAIKVQIGEMLEEKRASLPSLVQRLLTDDMLKRARRSLAREVSDHLPELIDQTFGLLSENVSIRRLIAAKVAAFELERLEEVIFSLAARELRQIELLCGLLGFLIGLCQLVFSLSA